MQVCACTLCIAQEQQILSPRVAFFVIHSYSRYNEFIQISKKFILYGVLFFVNSILVSKSCMKSWKLTISLYLSIMPVQRVFYYYSTNHLILCRQRIINICCLFYKPSFLIFCGFLIVSEYLVFRFIGRSFANRLSLDTSDWSKQNKVNC